MAYLLTRVIFFRVMYLDASWVLSFASRVSVDWTLVAILWSSLIWVCLE